MTTSSRTGERKRVPAGADADTSSSVNAKHPSLSERLPEMTDFKLNAYRASAARIGADPAHPKNSAARRAIPMIAAELQRRSSTPAK